MAPSIGGPATIGAITATVLVVAGAVVWLTDPGGLAPIGWFAYSPLGETVSFGQFALYGRQLVAAGLATIGLIVGGVALGFIWGRDVGRTEAPGGPNPSMIA